MDQQIDVRFRALPKQMAFLRSKSRELLYSGALGAGKTITVCLKCCMRASIPGAREGLCRLRLTDLKATTLKTLLEGDGDMPPILPPGTYEHNKSERVIRIHGGGEINYFGLVDASESHSKVGSRNLSGLGIDQVEEVPEGLYLASVARCRVKVADTPNQTYSACNPGPPSHYLAQRFGIVGNDPAPETCVVTTRSSDNTHLPASYISLLNTFKGVRYKRYVEGLWVGSDGLVYDRWSRDRHVVDRPGPWTRCLLGVDDGYTNPFVIVRGLVDGDGRLFIDRERYEPGLLPDAKVAAVKSLLHVPDGPSCEAVLVDPSAPDLIQIMRNAGIPAVAANNEVEEGINRVQQRLEDPGDGWPRLAVHPSCANLRDEFESYEWRKSTDGTRLKDEPKKENDHAMDALRYLVARLDMRAAMIAHVADPARRPEVKAETAAGTFARLRMNPDWGFDEDAG